MVRLYQKVWEYQWCKNQNRKVNIQSSTRKDLKQNRMKISNYKQRIYQKMKNKTISYGVINMLQKNQNKYWEIQHR